jgi:TolB protein
VYSPDGRYIAFRSNREGQWNVYVMPAEGGSAVKVSGAGNNLNAVWSPDSRYLAYQSDRNGQTDIYVAEVAAGTEIRVTDHPAADQAPAWDCNSRRVVFQSKRDENWNLYLADIFGKSPLVQLTNHPRIDAYPMWNPGEEDASLAGLGVLLGNR